MVHPRHVPPSTTGSQARSEQFKYGDLVLVKVPDHPTWPAKICRAEDFQRTPDRTRYYVQLFGTNEIAFAAPSDIQPFTGGVKSKPPGRSYLAKCFARAIKEICESYKRKQNSLVIKDNPTSERVYKENEAPQEEKMSALSYSKGEGSTPSIRQLLALAKEKFKESRSHQSLPKDVSRTPISGSDFQTRADLSVGGSLSTEAVAARDAFRRILDTLSDTKETIHQATCHAFDCAKNGIASEVIELIMEKLQNEENMHGRVKYFFLVDSIMRRSHKKKDIVGPCFTPIVQDQLPLLLGATATFVESPLDNHKQCAKILRLWIQKKIMPESFLQPYVDAIEPFIRDSSPADRSVNCRVRVINGMLIEEYGSNLLSDVSDEEDEIEDVTVHLKEKIEVSPEGNGSDGRERNSPPAPPDSPPPQSPLPPSAMPPLPPDQPPSPPPPPPPLPWDSPNETSHQTLPNSSYPPIPYGYAQQYQTTTQMSIIPPPSRPVPSSQFSFLNSAAKNIQPSESRLHLQAPVSNNMVFHPSSISRPWPSLERPPAHTVAFQPFCFSQEPTAHIDDFQTAVSNTVASRPPTPAGSWTQPMMSYGQPPTSQNDPMMWYGQHPASQYGSWRPI